MDGSSGSTFSYRIEGFLRAMPVAEVVMIQGLLDADDSPDSRELAGRVGTHLAHNLSEEFEFDRHDLSLLWHALRDADVPVGSGPSRLRDMLRPMVDDGAIG